MDRNVEFALGYSHAAPGMPHPLRAPNQSGVNTLFSPVASGVRKVNDGIFTGPRGAFQRYNVSSAALDVVKRPNGGPN